MFDVCLCCDNSTFHSVFVLKIIKSQHILHLMAQANCCFYDQLAFMPVQAFRDLKAMLILFFMHITCYILMTMLPIMFQLA